MLRFVRNCPASAFVHAPPTIAQGERMGHPAHANKINYIEFSTSSIANTKTFYSKVFGWEFQDWGEDYVSFSSESGGIDGGFRKGPDQANTGKSAPLIVLYSADLKATE